ncbi:hypothetical protein [Streptomyces sp. YIM S03343]
MAIEIVHEHDTDGTETGWYTESVPETYVKEEPDCYACNDTGCPACDGSQIDRSKTFTLTEAGWPRTGGTWGGSSNEPPF